jgi:anion transporter
MSQTATKLAFDPLDMKNYSLEKLPEMKGGRITEIVKMAGVPLAVFLFLFFELRWCGVIQAFETQAKVPPAACYSAMAIFFSSLALWLTEAIPNYLTSFMIILAAILTGAMKMRPAFAYMGEPVMILNIASFIMASSLVTTGLARRLSIYLVLRFFHRLDFIFLAFLALNLILGAFISATSAKTALLLPLFMVISAIFGATGGEYRNAVGKNMVLLNLVANNVSASAFMTGSAANLLAASLLQNAGASVYYGDWFMALFPLAVIQCAMAWWSGTRLIFPISKAAGVPKLEGGEERLRAELQKLGGISKDEFKAGLVFLTVLLLWSTDRFHGIRAEVVALAGATVVLMPSFMGLPRIGVLKWNQADIPWHMLMFSWGAYVLGGICEHTDIVGIGVRRLFEAWAISAATPKVLVFMALSGLFGITTLISESKTARTIVMFPILITTAKTFGWDLVGFCLPMCFMINQVYVLYFNSKPANISYLTNQYSNWESFKYGMAQLTAVWLLLVPWAQYVMPLMGFDSKLW